MGELMGSSFSNCPCNSLPHRLQRSRTCHSAKSPIRTVRHLLCPLDRSPENEGGRRAETTRQISPHKLKEASPWSKLRVEAVTGWTGLIIIGSKPNLDRTGTERCCLQFLSVRAGRPTVVPGQGIISWSRAKIKGTSRRCKLSEPHVEICQQLTANSKPLKMA